MLLVADGLPGSGKTFLLRELIAGAQESSDWSIGFTRADEIESNEPYSFIERFITGAVCREWRFVPDEQTTPVAVARECVHRLSAGADSPLRLIIVDDAQWVDPESQRVLRYLIPRIVGQGILLAFGVRAPHTSPSFGEFLCALGTESPFDRTIHLDPLTVPEIIALAHDRLGMGIPPETAQRLLDLTDGSFLGVDSAFSALTEDEVTRLHLAYEVPLRVSTTHDDLILRGFHQLSPAARSTCEIVCLADHELTRASIAAAARLLGEAVHLEESVAVGLLDESGFGSTILSKHALFSRAVRDTVPTERAASVYRALAEVTTGHRSLLHALRGARSWDAELRDRVNAHVVEVLEKGSTDQAIEVLRGALEVATAGEDRTELLESLALIYLRDKAGYRMIDLLDEIEQLPESILQQFITIVVSAHRTAQTMTMERAQRLLMTPATTPEERTIIALFAFMAVMLGMRSRDEDTITALIDHAKALVAQSPADASELSDQRLAWMLSRQGHSLVLDCYTMVRHQVRGDFDEVRAMLPELTQRIESLPDEPLKIDAIVSVAGAQVAVGDAGAALALAQQGVALLDRVGEPWAAGTARVILIDCLVIHGDFAQAWEIMDLSEESLHRSLDVETRTAWAALRAIISAITARDGVEEHLELARRAQVDSWEAYAPDLSILAECEVARVRGDSAAILQATSGDWAKQLRVPQHGFLTFRAHALIDEGRLAEAAELVQQLAEWRGTRWQEFWGSLDWLRARLAQADGDEQTAQWHYESAAQTEFPLPRALALAHYGDFLLQQGRLEEAAAVTGSAVRLLEEIGAHGYLPTLLDHPVAPAEEQHGPKSVRLSVLTEREQQIADQLAKGRSNNQIAESLVVSVTTVRSHVSNVLRKLGLSSRGEVARFFREELDGR
ncbi:LuxR C-terminal-related transcriptional regulator [Leucobacter sp. GX24907]